MIFHSDLKLAFKEIPFGWKPDATNPNEVLGKDTDITTEKFLDISQQLIDLGSIIGGCCEITPSHISKLKSLNVKLNNFFL